MALKGDLTNVNLADIFQTLAMNLQEGVLIITNESRVKKIYFKDGKISLLGSRNKRGFRLGDRLISLGRLSPEDLNAALLQHESSGEQLGKTLVNMNLVSPEDLDETLRFQAEEEIYELFTWKDAHFEFVEGPPRERVNENNELAEIFLNVSNVIMEAARRVDEWEVIRQDLTDLNQVFVATEDIGPELEGQIDWLSLKVLKLINGRRSVIDVSEETCYSTFDLAKIVCSFLKDGRIRPATLDELEESLETLLREKEYNRALKILNKVIELAPDKSPYLKRAAELSHRTGRFEDASGYYQELAKSCEAGRNLVDAEKYLRRAVKLDLRNEEIHEALLRVLAEQGDWEQYLEHSLKAADLAAKSGAYERACEILERASTERPDDLQIVSQLSNVYIKLNRKDEAVARLQSLLAHLNPRKDRRKIEIIGEKILKLGFRDAQVVNLIQRAKRSRRASTKRKLAVAASLIPALVIASYLYDGYHRQREANRLLLRAQQAVESGDLWRAKNVLITLKEQDPDADYCPEWPSLARKVQDSLRKRLKAIEDAKDRENQYLFQAAAEKVESKDYADAVKQYLKLGSKNKTGKWRERADSRLGTLKEVLFNELNRLEKARLALNERVAQMGGKGEQIIEEYDRLLEDPVKEKVMVLGLHMRNFEGPEDLLARVKELKRPIQKILALFEEIYGERQVHEEVNRKDELVRFVSSEWLSAQDAFNRGDLAEAKRRLQNIINSSYSNKPLVEIKEFHDEVNRLIELQKKTKKLQEINRLEPLFQRVVKTLKRYPHLETTMKLPLQIKTIPPGAKVIKGGELLGTADPSLNITYQRNSNEEIEIRLDGFTPLKRSLKENRDWLWEVTLVREVIRKWELGGPSWASPAYDGRYVFVPCRDGTVYIIDPRQDDFAFKLKTRSIGGCPAKVTFIDSELYFPVQEGIVHAFDRGSWRSVWSRDLESPIYGTPAVTAAMVVVGTKAGTVKALARQTGDELWSFKAGDQILGDAVVHGQRVYVTSFDRHLYALDLKTGALAWKFAAKDIIEAAPAVASDGTIFMVDKWRYLYAIDPAKGKMLWKAKVGGSAAAPVIYEGDILVAATDKVVRRLRGSDGTEVGAYRTDGTLAASPLVVDGKLYQGAKDGYLWVYELATGKLLWRFLTGGPILTTPLRVEDHVFVVSTDRQVYMFKL